MNSKTVSQEWIDRIHKQRLYRWGKLPPWKQIRFQRFGKKKSGFPGFWPSCEGCHLDLKPGDLIIEFRPYRYCHDTLTCLDRLDPYSITLELRKYVKDLLFVKPGLDVAL